jgi:hypothetical protein
MVIKGPGILSADDIQEGKGDLQRKGFTASGTVYARVVLPPGMEVGLHVGRVLPDVLVFDGEVPEDADLPAPFLPPSHLDEDESSPFPSFPVPVPSFPLPGPFPGLPLPLPRRRPREGGDTDPAPLPARAFGHIRPTDWLVSQSGPAPSEDGEGAAFAVTAKIVEVPLEVLPGREREFADFVGKVGCVVFVSSSPLYAFIHVPSPPSLTLSSAPSSILLPHSYPHPY